MIKLKDVSKFYYNKGIIASGFTKVSLEFSKGEFVVITGESGSGKSTLLNVISGLDSYEEGEMYINGKETSHYTEEDFENYRKKYISNIFQNFNLVNSYTVYQNIELVLLINGFKKHEVKNKILNLIKEVDLEKYKNTKVSKLSGGQKQRVAIARALAKDTPIIIADEPTGNLDKKSAVSVMETLANVAKDKLVIIVTHNYEQMEEYATRKITMHDGRVIEDKVISKPQIKDEFIIPQIKKMSLINKLRLGIRNAFNIKVKLFLLLIVYLFISIALILENSSFKKSEYLSTISGDNNYFKNISNKRIVLKKNDKSYFTDEDYQKIKTISNIDYIVKNDLELDTEISLINDKHSIYISGTANNISEFKIQLKDGVMPKNDNEIVVCGEKDDYLIIGKTLINSEVSLEELNKGTMTNHKYKIVGICEDKGLTTSRYQIYGKSNFLSIVGSYVKNDKNVNSLTINNKKIDNIYYEIIDIPKGYVYLNANLNAYCSYGTCQNSSLTLNVNNLYYQNNLTLKVKKTYDKDNYKALINLDNKDNYLNNNYVFMNSEDYNTLISNNDYQSSIFVKDEKLIRETKEELTKKGYNALIVTDALVNYNETVIYVLKIVNVFVTSVMIIVMFFISYLIIKIILKSRNTYYSTLRILGSNVKDAKKLLLIELLTVTNLAYLIDLVIIILNKKDYFFYPGLKSLVSYMALKDYIFIYLALIMMTYLIAMRFAKSLFKTSAIKTYNEGGLE